MVLLIGGYPRSGTTMLWKLCTRHPEIKLSYEFGEFFSLGRSYWQYTREMIAHMRRRGIFKNRVLGQPETDNRLLRGMNVLRCYHFAARYLFRLFAYRQTPINPASVEASLKALFPRANIVGDKYPAYVFMLDELIRFEELSCLIIYRDCRDVVSSVLKRARTDWHNEPWVTSMDTAEKIARQWVGAIEMMERYADRMKMIRYEDLVQKTERELGTLGNWLKVDPEGFPKELIRETSIGAYKNGLTDQELMDIMNIAGPTLTRLGYC